MDDLSFWPIPDLSFMPVPTPYYENPILKQVLRVGVLDADDINITVVEGALLQNCLSPIGHEGL